MKLATPIHTRLSKHQHLFTTALGIVITFKITFIFIFAWHILLVMDEFAQVGYAKYFSNGLFTTVQPSKAVGFAVFYKIAHLVGWNASSILLIGRIQTALLACATLALIYACARLLEGNRVRALLVVLILLCFSNFMERIFRRRSEPIAVFFAVTALWVILQGHTISAKRILFAGLFSGLAFLVTQKSVYFNLALGLGLVIDALMRRNYAVSISRGLWLVGGWGLPVIAYCVIFGGSDPIRIAAVIIFGPVEVALRGNGEYEGLRLYVLQTLIKNPLLYLLCFSGMILTLSRIKTLDERKRIALIFSAIITMLVFLHDQPWPYVFIMALPFMSLWPLAAVDFLIVRQYKLLLACVIAGITLTIASSCADNIRYLNLNNRTQLELVVRAEAMIKPHERYFDGIGMIPNRLEPTPLWLDMHYVLETLRQGKRSEAYQIFSHSPPKIVLWSYRMDRISPVVAEVIHNSYTRVAPNIRIAGRLLHTDHQEIFNVPLAGQYRLYSEAGNPLSLPIEIDGSLQSPPFHLSTVNKVIMLRDGPATALLLPEGAYDNLFKVGDDNEDLFANTYSH